MRTVKLSVSYDGTDYIGWQRQAAGTSVQGLLEEALESVVGHAHAIAGAGRTDAGVHAVGQVASVVVDSSMPLATLVRALNAHLPPDVRVLDAEDRPASFHARFSARRKVYVYRLLNTSIASPFEHRYAWHCPIALDLDAMQRAIDLLVGTHDFSAFRGAGSEVASSVRTLQRATVTRTSSWTARRDTVSAGGGLVEFRFEADGFLRHMVRNIVGTAVDIGRGRMMVDDVPDLVASRDRRHAGPTAPPEGLFLLRVDYEEEVR